MKLIKNKPELAGTIASKKTLHAPRSRFATYAVHARFDAVEWLVADAETKDPLTDLPAIVGQHDTEGQALEHVARLSETAERELASYLHGYDHG